MVELDYKSVNEIIEIRKSAVAKNFDLISKQYFESIKNSQDHTIPYWKKLYNQYFGAVAKGPAEYKPNSAIFGQIVGGKPWWGILGICYYGPGPHGIEGLSEESRILVNPYLIVGLVESSASIIGQSELKPIEIYPKPEKLIWNSEKNTASVVYDLSSYLSLRKKYKFQDRKLILNLVAYNAKDFGYEYLFLDPNGSRNVKTLGQENQAVELVQYIHLGNSCGYPGGCNNMSPYVAGLEIEVSSLPARAQLKLWKNAPSNISNTAEFDFIIEIK